MFNDIADVLKNFGFSENYINILLIIGIIFGIFVSIIKAIKWAILKECQLRANENLSPYYSERDVDKATRFYIPTKYQNVSPSADEEPGKSHIASAKNELIPLFIKKAFKDDHNNNKYYLILADTGMGKTTFLVNLFLKYTSRPVRNLFGSVNNKKIVLLPLGSPNIWADIEKIEAKKNTILLLDAFDEDVKAVDDHEARMKEILSYTKEFKQILITCRTQFFPTDKEIPDDTGYATFGGEQETFKFQRVYISVFDEQDIKKYLKKRFSIFQRKKRKRAFQIVKKSPNLVMRPMLLSYINDLVDTNRTFHYSYEIYEVLVEKWIERESKKQGIRQKYGSEEKYQELLLNFSQSLATDLYTNRDARGGYFVNRNEIIKTPSGLKISDIEQEAMTETEVRSKSMLNRNAEGKYKFSHKSIMEYFLAKEILQKPKFFKNFNFEGMSTAEDFVNEMVSPIYSFEGIAFLAKSNEFPDHSHLKIRELSAKIIPKVEVLQIFALSEVDPAALYIFVNLKKLVLQDNYKYYLLHSLYELFIYTILDFKFSTKIFNQLERYKFIDLVEHLREIQQHPAEYKTNFASYPSSRKIQYRDSLIRDIIRTQNMGNPIAEVFKPHYSQLNDINNFMAEMKILKKMLPNCDIIY